MIVSDAHRDFAKAQLAKLASYDAQRPENHLWFHKHSERMAGLTKALALAAGYSSTVSDALCGRHCHDIRKTTLPVEIWGWGINNRRSTRCPPHIHEEVDMVRDTFGHDYKNNSFLCLMTE